MLHWGVFTLAAEPWCLWIRGSIMSGYWGGRTGLYHTHEAKLLPSRKGRSHTAFKEELEPVEMVHAFHPSIWEAKAGGSLRSVLHLSKVCGWSSGFWACAASALLAEPSHGPRFLFKESYSMPGALDTHCNPLQLPKDWDNQAQWLLNTEVNSYSGF